MFKKGCGEKIGILVAILFAAVLFFPLATAAPSIALGADAGEHNGETEYAMLHTAGNASEGEWMVVGEKPIIKSGEFDGYIYAIAKDLAGNLYIGGAFSHVNGIEVNGIAKWDGSSWSGLGSELGVGVQLLTTGVVKKFSGTVNSIKVDAAGNLYVGGGFIYAGGLPCFGIAKWDGNSWSNVGGGLQKNKNSGYGGYPFAYDPGQVKDIAIAPGGDVYVGGDFYYAGGGAVKSHCVAKWDGLEWQSLHDDRFEIFTIVYALGLDSQGNLYAGGSLRSDFAHQLVKWDGSCWQPYGDKSLEDIYTILVDPQDNVYPGGAWGVYKLKDGKWQRFSATNYSDHINAWTMDKYRIRVNALAMDKYGHLYAGGEFTTIGETKTPACHIAKWDGHTWQALASGAESAVWALYLDEDDTLYRGGETSEKINGLAGWKVSQDAAQYAVSVSANPAEGGTVTGAGVYKEGAAVSVTAAPAPGYRFTNWSQNGTVVSTEAGHAFICSGDMQFIANFELGGDVPPSEDATDLTPAAGPPVVSGDKIWTITFSRELAHSSINQDTFKVSRPNGEELNTERGYFTIEPDDTKMQVKPGGGGYDPGEYILRIAGVKSKYGQELAKPVIMKFLVR